MKNKGFTLIEILVVVVLFGLMSAWYTNGYFKQREKENLLSALSNTRSYLDNIRQASVSVLIPTGVEVEDFLGYGFNTNILNNSITRAYVTDIGTNNLDSLNFKKFSHIELVEPNLLVYFAKGSGYLLSSLHTQTTITIKLKNTLINQCATLQVNEQGIFTTDENVTCDP